MPDTIPLLADVEIGVVPTHVKFVGGLVPDDDGKLPRESDGALVVVAEMARLTEACPVKLHNAQIPFFPGMDAADTAEAVEGLRALGLDVHLIMMVGGADPMKPEDEEAVAGMLVAGLEAAKLHSVKHVSSTSFEEWLSGGGPKTGADFDAAVAQLAKVHVRAYNEAGVEGSCIQNWHLEFLRTVEFQTFTNAGVAWEVVKACNASLGKTFWQLMVDAAHCGDSGLSIPENEKLIEEMAATGEFGIFHASAKTTRGCLSTDDGWIGSLMAAAAKTGELKTVFIELFHHEDPALEGLRDLDPGHGIDTTNGRTYTETTIDGVVELTRRLNNLKARGMLS